MYLLPYGLGKIRSNTPQLVKILSDTTHNETSNKTHVYVSVLPRATFIFHGLRDFGFVAVLLEFFLWRSCEQKAVSPAEKKREKTEYL